MIHWLLQNPHIRVIVCDGDSKYHYPSVCDMIYKATNVIVYMSAGKTSGNHFESCELAVLWSFNCVDVIGLLQLILVSRT